MAFSLPGLLAAAAERWPERTAVRSGGEDVTYAQLQARAGAVARMLGDHGLERAGRVAVYCDRSPDSLAAIYGIMGAGGAYVPLDSSAPPDRLAAVLADCDVRHVVTGPGHLDGLRAVLARGPGVTAILGAGPADGFDGAACVPWDALAGYACAPPPTARVIERDLCLIFYTSGSTGKPKGVAHAHRSMVSNVEWALAEFGVVPGDRVANVTSHHFDLSWFEMFVTAAAGATLVMAPQRTVAFPASLADLVAAERVSVWCSVPSVLVGLVQRGVLAGRDLAALRLVLFAGERFPVKHLRALMAGVPHPRYVNMYGTTETHIAAFHEVPVLDGDEPLPIGDACAHVDLGIVAPGGGPAAPGEAGELVIRGPSVMEGYWKLPDRTAAALRPETVGGVTDVAYHTGDLVRRRAGGAIEIIGRADRRVKIRGYLVDLDEVETVLLAHGGVEEAAAWVLDEDTAGARVAGAVRLRAGATGTASQLRVHVAAVLPTYAVPEVLEVLDDFPRTGSGKTSRNDLAAVVAERVAARRAGAAARDGEGSPFEALRAYLASEIADDPEAAAALGPDDDLLGHGVVDSMGVVQLVVFIEDRWGVTVPNDEFVLDNFLTLRAIARLVDRL